MNSRSREIVRIHNDNIKLQSERERKINEINQATGIAWVKNLKSIHEEFWTYHVGYRNVALFTTKEIAESFMPKIVEQLGKVLIKNRKLSETDLTIHIIKCHYSDVYFISCPGTSRITFDESILIDQDPSIEIAKRCWDSETCNS